MERKHRVIESFDDVAVTFYSFIIVLRLLLLGLRVGRSRPRFFLRIQNGDLEKEEERKRKKKKREGNEMRGEQGRGIFKKKGWT